MSNGGRMTVKPVFGYFGAKTALADVIVRQLPRHKHYVEVFAGSLAVLLAKPESHLETANDLDGGLLNFWKQLRDHPVELARACALTPHSRAEHAQAQRAEVCEDEVEWARRVWVQLTQGRLGVRNTTGWRYFIAGGSQTMPDTLDTYVERLAAVAARIRRVSLECLPAVELIKRYGQDPNVLIYADPPYLMGSHDGVMDASGYMQAMADELSHREMAQALNECRAAVVLSGYAHPLYDEEFFPHWVRVELNAWTGNGLAREGGDKKQGERTEVLWANRPLPSAGRREIERVKAEERKRYMAGT